MVCCVFTLGFTLLRVTGVSEKYILVLVSLVGITPEHLQ